MWLYLYRRVEICILWFFGEVGFKIFWLGSQFGVKGFLGHQAIDFIANFIIKYNANKLGQPHKVDVAKWLNVMSFL